MEWWSIGVMKQRNYRFVLHSITPLLQCLEPDRVPRGLHFHGVEDPVGVVRVGPPPLTTIKRAPDVAFIRAERIPAGGAQCDRVRVTFTRGGYTPTIRIVLGVLTRGMML